MKRLLIVVAVLYLSFVAFDYLNLFQKTHVIGLPGCSVTLTIDNRGNVEHEVSDTKDC